MARTKADSWSDDPKRAVKDKEHAEAVGQETKASTVIVLPKLDVRILEVTLVGDSPLICNRWSEKAKTQMRDKQMGKASAGRQAKDPEADYQASLYKLPDGGYGFPSIAFKSAAVTACTSLGKAVTKVAARQAFHVMGELVRIEGTPRMREDMVNVGGASRVADLRYRGEFPDWKVKLRIRYNNRVLSAEQVVNLFAVAGFAVGVGEWRSEKDGGFGLFHVGQ